MSPREAENDVLDDVRRTLQLHMDHSRIPELQAAATTLLRRLVTNQPLATPAPASPFLNLPKKG